jgi:hypothetical protein
MTNPTTRTPDPDEPVTYEICLEGHLDSRWADRLDVPELAHQPDGTTVLRLAGADQSALHGLLQRIRDLNLTLISVARLDPAGRSGSTVSPFPTDPEQGDQNEDHR